MNLTAGFGLAWETVGSGVASGLGVATGFAVDFGARLPDWAIATAKQLRVKSMAKLSRFFKSLDLVDIPEPFRCGQLVNAAWKRFIVAPGAESESRFGRLSGR